MSLGLNLYREFTYTIFSKADADVIRDKIFSKVKFEGNSIIKPFNGKFAGNSFTIHPGFLDAPRFLLGVIIQGEIISGDPTIIKLKGSLNQNTISALYVVLIFNLIILAFSPVLVRFILRREGVLDQYYLLIYLIPLIFLLFIFIFMYLAIHVFAKYKIEESVKLIHKMLKQV